MRLSDRLAITLLVVLSAGQSWAAEDDGKPDAVPYRPTVSTPATLTAPGWLESEFGGLYLQHRHVEEGGDRRTSLPYTLKYAFTDDWGVRIGGEALAHVNHGDGSRDTGFGDTSLVAKRRFAVNPSSAFGLEVGATFPTARPALQTGSGKTDWSLNGIYSADIGAWHGDVNLLNTRLGTRIDGQSRLQTLGAFAISRPISERWTLAGELSGVRQHGAPGTSQFLSAASFALRRDIVFDVGAAHGLNRASPTWQAFTGVTMVLGRID